MKNKLRLKFSRLILLTLISSVVTISYANMCPQKNGDYNFHAVFLDLLEGGGSCEYGAENNYTHGSQIDGNFEPGEGPWHYTQEPPGGAYCQSKNSFDCIFYRKDLKKKK